MQIFFWLGAREEEAGAAFMAAAGIQQAMSGCGSGANGAGKAETREQRLRPLAGERMGAVQNVGSHVRATRRGRGTCALPPLQRHGTGAAGKKARAPGFRLRRCRYSGPLGCCRGCGDPASSSETSESKTGVSPAMPAGQGRSASDSNVVSHGQRCARGGRSTEAATRGTQRARQGEMVNAPCTQTHLGRRARPACCLA